MHYASKSICANHLTAANASCFPSSEAQLACNQWSRPLSNAYAYKEDGTDSRRCKMCVWLHISLDVTQALECSVSFQSVCKFTLSYSEKIYWEEYILMMLHSTEISTMDSICPFSNTKHSGDWELWLFHGKKLSLTFSELLQFRDTDCTPDKVSQGKLSPCCWIAFCHLKFCT